MHRKVTLKDFEECIPVLSALYGDGKKVPRLTEQQIAKYVVLRYGMASSRVIHASLVALGRGGYVTPVFRNKHAGGLDILYHLSVNAGVALAKKLLPHEEHSSVAHLVQADPTHLDRPKASHAYMAA